MGRSLDYLYRIQDLTRNGGNGGQSPNWSAENRRIVGTSICFSVKVSDLSTVGDQVTDRIQSVRLNNGGEGHHLALSTRMPDDTLNETLAASNREEVGLGGGGQKAHGVSCVDELSIG